MAVLVSMRLLAIQPWLPSVERTFVQVPFDPTTVNRSPMRAFITMPEPVELPCLTFTVSLATVAAWPRLTTMCDESSTASPAKARAAANAVTERTLPQNERVGSGEVSFSALRLACLPTMAPMACAPLATSCFCITVMSPILFLLSNS